MKNLQSITYPFDKLKVLSLSKDNLQPKAVWSLVVGSWLLVTPIFALALKKPPGGGGGLPPGKPITLDVLDYLIFRVSTFFISISAVLAMIFIIWAGVTYMYAGDDSTKITAAQGRLKSGIIGAAIIFGVGVIIQTIASVITLDFFCTVRIPIIGTCIY